MHPIPSTSNHTYTYDSGTSAPWRAAGYKGTRKVPRPTDNPARPLSHAADSPQPDYVAAMNENLWRKTDSYRREEIQRDRQEEATVHNFGTRPRKVNSTPPAAKGLFDMAVALAIHASCQSAGPARGRNIMRCLDALERAVAAGHPGPNAAHQDFAAVSDQPRFQRLLNRCERRRA